MFTVSRNQSEFYPEKDVTRRTEDGREIVIARKGTPMPMAKAKQLGLIKDEKTEENRKRGWGLLESRI